MNSSGSVAKVSNKGIMTGFNVLIWMTRIGLLEWKKVSDHCFVAWMGEWSVAIAANCIRGHRAVTISILGGNGNTVILSSDTKTIWGEPVDHESLVVSLLGEVRMYKDNRGLFQFLNGDPMFGERREIFVRARESMNKQRPRKKRLKRR